MLFNIIDILLSKILWFGLHIESNTTFKKPLSFKEEQECFKNMSMGDVKARDKLIEHNLRLVVHITKKYYTKVNEQEDLISIGTIGLIKAVNTFTYEKSPRFSTYASRCIENEILMYFRNIKKSQGDVYMNEPIDSENEGNTITLLDVFSDEESIIDNIDIKLKSEKLYQFIEKNLSKREQLIIKMRYGIGGYKELTQREIAKKLNISRSYVSRIEKKALEILRDKFDEANIKF